MQRVISGIQQIGIGIPNVYEAWEFYRKSFSMDVPIFDEAAVAALMLPYTGGKPQERHAVLAINLQGGGGFEIWQYKGRTPVAASFEIQLGDYGIEVAMIKCKDVQATHNLFKYNKFNVLTEVIDDPRGVKCFYMKDPYNNIFRVQQADNWFQKGKKLTGGPEGAILGVSNMEKSMAFYRDILGYDEVMYDKAGKFSDLASLAGGEGNFRRVLLTHSKPREGAFSRLFGTTYIELLQAQERTPRKIYEGRFWGDLGFIHLCFDISGMSLFRELCKEKGHPFTVDTGDSFDMGEAAGAFSYIEDPDGTLIEFVETHKIPIMKKVGWYLDLRNRNPRSPLPNWMLKALKFARKKD